MSQDTTPGTTTTTTTENDPFNVAYWRKRWEEDKIGWHKNAVNPLLLKYIGLVTGQKLSEEPLSDPKVFEENSTKTWFVPLCGKSLDISYLLSQGFKVFAVEAIRMAIETMSKEQSLDLEYDEEKKLFVGANGRLVIYNGDLFTFPIETFGPVDYVWDRGSFIAVEYPFREKYIETVQKILKRPDGSWYDFKYLLETVMYDKSKFGGPPRSVTDEDIKTYYAPWSNVEFLISEKLPDGHRIYKEVGEGGAVFRCFLVTPSK